MVQVEVYGLVTKAKTNEYCWLVWYMPYKKKIKNRGVQVTLALGRQRDGSRINIVVDHHGGEEMAEYHPVQMAGYIE